MPIRYIGQNHLLVQIQYFDDDADDNVSYQLVDLHRGSDDYSEEPAQLAFVSDATLSQLSQQASGNDFYCLDFLEADHSLLIYEMNNYYQIMSKIQLEKHEYINCICYLFSEGNSTLFLYGDADNVDSF